MLMNYENFRRIGNWNKLKVLALHSGAVRVKLTARAILLSLCTESLMFILLQALSSGGTAAVTPKWRVNDYPD